MVLRCNIYETKFYTSIHRKLKIAIFSQNYSTSPCPYVQT